MSLIRIKSHDSVPLSRLCFLELKIRYEKDTIHANEIHEFEDGLKAWINYIVEKRKRGAGVLWAGSIKNNKPIITLEEAMVYKILQRAKETESGKYAKFVEWLKDTYPNRNEYEQKWRKIHRLPGSHKAKDYLTAEENYRNYCKENPEQEEGTAR